MLSILLGLISFDYKIISVFVKSTDTLQDINELEKAIDETLTEYENIDNFPAVHSPHDSIVWKNQNRKAEMAKEINMGKFSFLVRVFPVGTTDSVENRVENRELAKN